MSDESNYSNFLHDLAMRESSGNATAVNDIGFIGLFQMGEPALYDLGYYNEGGGKPAKPNDWTGNFTGKNGISNLGDFLANPEGQVIAITEYHQKIENFIDRNNLTQYIGKTINGVEVTMAGMIAGGHLVGMGDLKEYLLSNGENLKQDRNIVQIQTYMQEFKNAGFNHIPDAGSFTVNLNYCFPAGTMIALADGGQKAIEDIRVTDKVLTYDADGRAAAGEVVRLYRNVTPHQNFCPFNAII